MPRKKKSDPNLINSIFTINESINLNADEKEYLEELNSELIDLIKENGEEDTPRIKEIVLDALIEDEQNNLIDYLSLNIAEDTKKEIESYLEDDNNFKIENTEQNQDLFKSILYDETLNDILFTWRGFIKKTEGTKEVFIKNRPAILPHVVIDSLYSLLLDNFNKINFMSVKEDEEQARLIMLTINQAQEILMELPYSVCGVNETIEVLSTFSVKMTNLIGLSKDFRKDLYKASSESYESRETRNAKEKKSDID